MIQRVQTIFLAIVAIAMFAMIFMPIWAKQQADPAQTVVLDAMGMVYSEGGEVKEQTNTMYIGGIALLIATVAVGSIFSYKNRSKQIKLNLLNALLLFVLAAINSYWIFYEGKNLIASEDAGHFGFGFFLPLVGLIFNSLANRFIMKDEKLVRSVDRLR